MPRTSGRGDSIFRDQYGRRDWWDRTIYAVSVLLIILGAVIFYSYSGPDEAEEERKKVERLAEREQEDKERLERILERRALREAGLAEYQREFRSLADKHGKTAADYKRLEWLGVVIYETEQCLWGTGVPPAYCD